MTDIYRRAFTEVYEIINYLDDNDYNKIPREVIEGIESNRDQEYEYFLDETIPFEEQNMLPETRAILFNFFRDYFATKEQKEKILNFQRNQRAKLDEEKREIYDVNIFKNKEINNKTEEKELIKVEKNQLNLKNIFNFIKKMLNRTLKK